ncbi:hypothetical protein EJP82_11465 [Paenibacillus anaericanus]|uniref:HEAT repeat domain-containing protein n=1 Tax=Paenibacillus anaericanus TaxID=170367 RepID=A0A3S1BPI6_9BACL|nr:hypothetical protein [Paenibacillus anaericanus]RUT46464.1 hypothetical protein EJP82_11465 [Paenibacillus anaericanus]
MLTKLASSLGRNDEEPNIELAVELCETNNIKGIEEIVQGLKSKEIAIANDCIKVLYEIGSRKPELIADYTNEFISLLLSKNNRLAWGSMTALATIADLSADEIYSKLDIVKKAYEAGSVITVDNSITVFAKLCKANELYQEEVFPFLMQHLATCRSKEVPQHAERMMICITADNSKDFVEVLEKRRVDLTDSQNKRINKISKSLST